jgi:EmrB/QacA subfamily drug resistance transporter
MATTPPASATARQWQSLVGLCLVTALVWVTASDISIALPAISTDLGGSMDTLQWAVNGYFLAGAFIIVGGRIGDIAGRRLVFAIGTLLVIVGSIVAGLSAVTGSPLILIIGRIIEGIGAAAILPTALAIIAVTFHGRQRETAIAAWIATCWGAQALGPLVGGAIVDTIGWTWIFWMNLPLGLAALALVWRTTTESRDTVGSRRVDVPGALVLVLAIVLLCYALTAADNVSVAVFAVLILGSILSFLVFILIERRTPNPVVVLSIFRNRRFDGATAANLIANIVFGAAIFFMSLYLQVVEGYSAITAGALLLPATIPILALNPLGTWLHRRFGPALPTTLGMGLLVVSGLLMLNLSGSYTELLPAFLLLGAGIGLQITPCAAVAVEDPGAAGEGVASGIFKSASMIGGSLGVAASTAVFQTSAPQKIEELLGTITPDAQTIQRILDVLTGGATPESIAPLIPGQDPIVFITAVFDFALGKAMWPSIIAAVVGAVLAAVLLRRRRVTAA